jgi:hypothetical protein
MLEPRRAPSRLVEDDGRVNVGWFDAPVRDANLAEAPARHLLSMLRDTPLGFVERRYRRLRLKEWEYVSVVTPRTFLGCFVFHGGYVGSGMAYVVDRKTAKRDEWMTLAPLGRGVTIAASSLGGKTRFSRPGWGEIAITSDGAKRRVDVDLAAAGGRPRLVAQVDIRDDGHSPEPVAVVERTAPGRWLYTHKCYGLEAGGTIRWGAMRDEVAMGEALAGIDFNRGFRPLVTHWNWAAATGRSRAGERIGFNLTAHRPHRDDDGPDGSPDAADCALWLGGNVIKIRRVAFAYDAGDLKKPWRIVDDDGLVELMFEPLGVRSEHTNLGLVVSRFDQPYGRFHGFLADRAGRRFELDDVFGVVEQMYARW